MLIINLKSNQMKKKKRDEKNEYMTNAKTVQNGLVQNECKNKDAQKSVQNKEWTDKKLEAS